MKCPSPSQGQRLKRSHNENISFDMTACNSSLWKGNVFTDVYRGEGGWVCLVPSTFLGVDLLRGEGMCNGWVCLVMAIPGGGGYTRGRGRYTRGLGIPEVGVGIPEVGVYQR